MPSHIPSVPEVGASSAPLMSAAYFIGARCRDYNDDYMQCKTESYGRGELDCLKEGRKVTRCAASVIKDINTNCLEEFRQHWGCLENNNHQLWQCRRPERVLNRCVFEKLVSGFKQRCSEYPCPLLTLSKLKGLEKIIPDTPKNVTPVHLREKQIFADRHQEPAPWEKGPSQPKEENQPS